MAIFSFCLGLSLTVGGYGLLVRGAGTIGLLLLLTAVILVAYSSKVSWEKVIAQRAGSPSGRYWWVVIIVLVIAAVNCFYQLEVTPYHFSGFEAGGGISALQLAHRAHPDYQRYLWSSLDRPFRGVALCPFFIYLLGGFFKIFGPGLLVLRSAGVFWGLASLVTLYFLINDLFGTRVAILTAFLTSISPWFLSIARSGTFLSISLCYFLLVLLFFYRGLKGKISCLLIAGGLLSLFRYFYVPVRILFPFLVLAGLHHWWLYPGPRRRKAFFLLLFLGGFFLVNTMLGPVLPRLSGTANIPIFFGSLPGETGFNIAVALTDLKRNLYAVFYNLFYQSHSVLMASPRGLLVNRGISLLAFLGLGWAVTRWKKENYFFLLLSLFLPILPVLLTTSRPGGYPIAQRCFLLAPFLSSSAAIMLCLSLKVFSVKWGKIGLAIGRTALLLCLIVISALNIGNYFRSPTHPGFPAKRIFAERCLLLLNDGYYLMIGESDWHSRLLIEFLTYPATRDIYTYFAFYPYESLRPAGRMEEELKARPLKNNPFFSFWSSGELDEVLSPAGIRKRKTAIVFENEMRYKYRPLLMKIKTFDPEVKITEIKGPDGLTIGFQCLTWTPEED